MRLSAAISRRLSRRGRDIWPPMYGIIPIILFFLCIYLEVFTGSLFLFHLMMLCTLPVSLIGGYNFIFRGKYIASSLCLLAIALVLIGLFDNGEQIIRRNFYVIDILTHGNYAASCHPDSGIPVGDSTIKICKKFDFSGASFVDLIVRIDGPSSGEEVLGRIFEDNVVPTVSRSRLITMGEIWPKNFVYHHLVGHYFILILAVGSLSG